LSGTVGIFPATYVEEVWTTNDDIIIIFLFCFPVCLSLSTKI
jgi:hypothetical protein